MKKLMFGIWMIDVCRSALSVRGYLFIVSWSCGFMRVFVVVELCVLCLVVLFGFACGLDPVMSLL